MLSRRIPVLFAIDEAQALFQQTTYRAPDYSPIESYSLSAPLLALDYLSGRKSLVSISVSSGSSADPNHSLEVLYFPHHLIPLPTSTSP
jgi:small subunit ribosomal protein S29